MFLLILPLIIAFPFLFLHLNDLPALHADEAWAFYHADQVLKGGLPWTGMHLYTGPFIIYFVALIAKFSGFKIWAIRSAIAAFWMVDLVLYRKFCERFFKNRSRALWATLILAVLPFFVGFGRIAFEVFAFNPTLALGALLLLPDFAEPRTRSSLLRVFLSGCCLGLGIWNHAVFVTFVMALGIAAFVKHGPSLLKRREFPAILSGAAVVLIPRLAHYFFRYDAEALNHTLRPYSPLRQLAQFPGRMLAWPRAFLETLHGDVFYEKFAGALRFHSPDLASWLLIFGILIVIRQAMKSKDRRRNPEFLFLIFNGLMFLFSVLICPFVAERYFLLLLYGCPIFITIGFEELRRIPISRIWVTAAMALFVALQAARTTVNLFLQTEETRRKTSFFPFAGSEESNRHYLPIDRVYEALIKIGARQVLSNYYISEVLRAHDLDNPRFSQVIIGNVDSPAIDPRLDLYCVLYGSTRFENGDFKNFELVSKVDDFLILRRSVN